VVGLRIDTGNLWLDGALKLPIPLLYLLTLIVLGVLDRYEVVTLIRMLRSPRAMFAAMVKK
jgi:hypothetical protein